MRVDAASHCWLPCRAMAGDQMTLTFNYHAIDDPVHPAPRDREIMVWVPKRKTWAKGRFMRGADCFLTKLPGSGDADVEDQPIFWAELDAMRPGGDDAPM